MSGFGPPPKAQGQRRNRNPILGGRIRRIGAGDHADVVPAWPLSKPTKRELTIWARLWSTPQSVAWESLGWPDVIARYARLSARAEQPGVPAILLVEVRQLEDRLGLSPVSLLRLRWEIIEEDEPLTGQGPAVLDIRERLKAVD